MPRGPTTRPHKTVYGAPRTWRSSRPPSFRLLQDNADKFQQNKDLTDRRIKAVEDAGAFRGLLAVDSMTVRSTEWPGDPAEAGAASAPGQRQHGGPTDEAGQTGCGEAAGRLPVAQAAQKRSGR